MGSRKIGRKASRSTWGNIIIVTLLVLIAVFMALPLVYAIVTAFKPIDELFMFPPRFFVMRPTTRNFKDLFALMAGSFVPFSRYLFNSLFISIVGTIGHVIIASMAAYPMSKHKFPGSKFLFGMIIFSLMFSGYVTNIPRFIIMSRLGWLNNYAAIILPALASTLGLYLMKQFMDQMISDTILEAARIDGAGELRTFWSIVMPNVKPAWLTLTLLAFQGLWGDSGTVALYITDEAKKTLPLALSYIQAGGIARIGAGAATALLLMAPPIIIFILSQSNVIETMKSSGMKD